jgi:hypothetical protein
MGLLRKFYWPSIDKTTIEALEAFRKDANRVKPTDSLYDQLMDLGYVACHKIHYRPWKRFTDYINDRSPFESRNVVRNNIKGIVFKLSYGRSVEMVSKDYILRKR